VYRHMDDNTDQGGARSLKTKNIGREQATWGEQNKRRMIEMGRRISVAKQKGLVFGGFPRPREGKKWCRMSKSQASGSTGVTIGMLC